MKVCLRGACLGYLALACSPLFALSGSGDSAAGSLDTVAPNPGTASILPDGIVDGEEISYTGASDASGIARVELWARAEGGTWSFSSLFETTESGDFTFIPPATGIYFFELVAEDTVGNRSVEPEGTTGSGQGSTNFTTNVGDWSLLE